MINHKLQALHALGQLELMGMSLSIKFHSKSFHHTHRRRQLPQAPTVQPNGYNGSRPSTGSATSPTSSTSKPVVAGFHADGLPNIHKAVPAVPPHTSGASVNGTDAYRLQQSDSSLDVQGYSVTAAPKSSPRPPGASPPNIPGHSNIFDDFSIDNGPDDTKNRPGHRHQQSSEQFRPADAYPQHHARLHPNDGINGPAPSARVNDLRHRPSSSSDYIPNCKSVPKRETLIADSPYICRSSRY
jgi:hypothetical protein